MTGCFRVFPLPKRGYTWLISSDGKMVEIGGNLALKSRNLALFYKRWWQAGTRATVGADGAEEYYSRSSTSRDSPPGVIRSTAHPGP